MFISQDDQERRQRGKRVGAVTEGRETILNRTGIPWGWRDDSVVTRVLAEDLGSVSSIQMATHKFP